MTAALSRHAFARPLAPWPRSAIVLGAVVAAILLIFRVDVVRLVELWWVSTTYGHCLFIGPVIAWLVWTRRTELARLDPAAWWPGIALVAVGGFGWLMGEAGEVAFARQFGLVMMLQGAVLTILGPQVARGLLFPLAYAFFLVPFGEELEPPLQTLTVALVMPMLHLVGVPAVSNGVLIHAGRYYFEVAEACSGAKFVIAMIAFGVLVANVCFVAWRRRAAFMAAALVVPVIANALRAFATIWAANLTSVEAATGFDHIVYGWVFFGIVMAAVLALGWRWFDRAPDAPAFDPAELPPVRAGQTGLLAASLLVVATAAVFPAWSAAVAGRAAPMTSRVGLPVVPSWQQAPIDTRAPWQPYHPGADRTLIGRYTDGTDAIDLAIAVYASQHDGKELVSFGTGVLREEDRWVRVQDLPGLADGSAVRITAPGPVERVVATWYVVGGTVTSDEKRVKIETMKARLFGGDQTAVAIHLSSVVHPGIDPQPAVARFLAALGPLDRVAARAAAR